MKSIGDVLAETKGVGKGFDFLRIELSVSVVAWHAFQIAHPGFKYVPGVQWLWVYSILGMFFGLSGFLIAGSALRLSLPNFLINRGLRIFPALAVEVILSAFILGPIFTTLPLTEYFTNHRFFYYLTNLFGAVYFFLPGVFNGEYVNGSIWTVPFEICCYVIISIYIYFGLLSRRWSIWIFVVLMLSVQVSLMASGYRVPTNFTHNLSDMLHNAPSNAIFFLFYSRGSQLLVAFGAGIGIYLYRNAVPYSKALFFGSLMFCVVAEFFGKWSAAEAIAPDVLLTMPLIYITIFIGVSRLPDIPLIRRGDYSYGVYLYGFPLTQATRFTFPSYTSNWVVLLVISMIPISVFAVGSWHLIERPILELRRRFSFVARERLGSVEPSLLKPSDGQFSDRRIEGHGDISSK